MLNSEVFEIPFLTVKANYTDWNMAKSQLVKSYPFNTPLYIHTDQPVGLTVDEMIRLRDFINEKLDFLERVQG